MSADILATGDAPLYYHGIREKITRTVRILMIAPEPFFEPRGTPFSEFHRIRALTALGHQVDLVTYPFGQDVSMPGLRVFRSLRPPFVHGVKIGPSLAKIPLDALLTLTALRRALSRPLRRHPFARGRRAHRRRARGAAARAAPLRHALEPAAAAHQLRVQPVARSSARAFLAIERFMIRRSRVVIVICPSLEDTVRAIDPRRGSC